MTDWPHRVLVSWRLLEDNSVPGRDTLVTDPLPVRVGGRALRTGLDPDGRRHLFIPVDDSEPAAVDEGTAVRVRVRTLVVNEADELLLDVECLRPDLDDLFTDLCVQIIQAVEADAAGASLLPVRVIERWRQLLRGITAEGLGRREALGLLGELLVLDDLLALNPADGDSAWQAGTDPSRHDFRRGAWALEVKTTTTSTGRMATVHGLEQMQVPPGGGELWVAWLRLEVANGGSFNLPRVVESLLGHTSHPQRLIECLSARGYDHAVSERYDRPEVDVVERHFFRVDDDFPRIVAASFSGGIPPRGVRRLEYEIDLSSQAPLNDADVGRVLATLAGVR